MSAGYSPGSSITASTMVINTPEKLVRLLSAMTGPQQKHNLENHCHFDPFCACTCLTLHMMQNPFFHIYFDHWLQKYGPTSHSSNILATSHYFSHKDAF